MACCFQRERAPPPPTHGLHASPSLPIPSSLLWVLSAKREGERRVGGERGRRLRSSRVRRRRGGRSAKSSWDRRDGGRWLVCVLSVSSCVLRRGGSLTTWEGDE
ncbi:hypothetical protein BDU57DRAFT_142667 [Ampelomyces quisqualis]|uniref:Uncharacterized protein n=1 Tax=Ampelomyces quisqualis TaxID=50730 RepID=A0A6A5QVT0_AMPQU|nr:hypothetical protein BDU57DRAFT_142667 [Ampelomyces quisqualis]